MVWVYVAHGGDVVCAVCDMRGVGMMWDVTGMVCVCRISYVLSVWCVLCVMGIRCMVRSMCTVGAVYVLGIWLVCCVCCVWYTVPW